MLDFGIDKPENKSVAPYRFKTFFLNHDGKDLVKNGRVFIRETMNLLPFIMMIPSRVKMELLDAGYVMNLSTGQVIALSSKPSERLFGTTIQMDPYASHPKLILNTLLSADPKRFGELGQAFKRSVHWSRLSKGFEDDGGKLLLSWIACESLSKTNEMENIAPKLLATLGFSRSTYFNKLPSAEKRALEAILKRKPWEKRLQEIFEKFRLARNNIVHSGFRELDLADQLSFSEILLIKRSLQMLIPRLHKLAIDALEMGITSLEQMWARYHECVIHRGGSPSIDLSNTVIPRLEGDYDPLDDY